MMISETWLIRAIIVVVIAIIVLVIDGRRRRRQELAAEGVPATESYSSRDDQTVAFFHDAAEEARQDSGRYDRRTLAELGSACSACNENHPGMCDLLEQYERDLTSPDIWNDTILTGKIVDEVPEQGPETASRPVVDLASSFVWEVEHEWHQDTAGNWQPPWALLDSLPDDDWLRDVLTTGSRELVAGGV